MTEAQMAPSCPSSPFITTYTQYVSFWMEDTQRLFIRARLIGTKEIRLAYLPNNNLKKKTMKSESGCK